MEELLPGPGNACAASALGELGVEYFCGSSVTTAEHNNNTGGVGETPRAGGGIQMGTARQLWGVARRPLMVEMTQGGWEAGTPHS